MYLVYIITRPIMNYLRNSYSVRNNLTYLHKFMKILDSFKVHAKK
jgi:hypothetical protein